MQSIKEFLGCECHSNVFYSESGPKDAAAYTFPWARAQYSEVRLISPVHESLELSINLDKEELSGIAFEEDRVPGREP